MFKVKVYVTLKESVIDPQGTAAKKALQTLQYKEITEVRIGKYIELTVEKSDKSVEQVVKEACEKLLVNENVEDYRYEIEEVVAQ